jgi:hypothetical protein
LVTPITSSAPSGWRTSLPIKPLIWSAAALATLILLAFFALPPLVKLLLTKKLSAALRRDVAIRTVRINPFTLSVTIGGLLIADRGTLEPFVSVGEIVVNLESSSAVRRALILKEVRLSGPSIRIVRHEDYSYNFSDLLAADAPKDGTPAGPPLFSLNNIEIVNGSVDFWDGPKETRHTVRDANIAIPFISNVPHEVETYVQPRFSAVINGSRYALGGKAKPFAPSNETSLDINIEKLDVPHYLAYLPVRADVKVRSALLDLKAQISFVRGKENRPSLVITGDLSLDRVSIHDPQDGPLLNVPRLEISLARLEPLAGIVHLARLSVQSPDAHVRRGRDGALSIRSLIPAAHQSPGTADAPAGAAGRTIRVDAIDVTRGRLAFSDLSRSVSSESDESDEPRPSRVPVLRASDIRLTAEHLSMDEGSRGTATLSLLLNETGRLAARGSVGLNPVSAQLAVEAKGVAIRPFQPYLADYVNIDVTSGSLTTSGSLSVSGQEGSGLRVAYKGDALLSKFSSIDKAQAQDFVTWESLKLGGLDVGYNPAYCRVKTAALADFYARVIVSSDGSVNLRQVFDVNAGTGAPAPGAQATPNKTPGRAASKPATDVRIERVTVQGGRINFSDNHVKPNYSANLVDVGGRISGLSSQANTVGDLDLIGKLDRYAPLEIKGKINPLRDDLFVDLKATFKDMDLSGVTPYSGKYLGYTIQKGKLSFDLTYLIVKRKLDSQNNVFLDQLEFGERVESPTATNLPVRLAVALLKDRKGEIRLDLPVSGSLDDPQFSVWKVIIQILVNLLAKAATAPFALLGAMLGGGEDLSHLEFEYGSAMIAQANAKALDVLIKALHERPSLKLEVEGHVDAEKDREGLRQFLFTRKLQAQKFNERLRQGSSATPVDELTIGPAEYERYLTMAYKAEKFPKPRNFLGFAKSLPAAEMEKLMLTHLQVGDDQLRGLASQRATRVKDDVVASGKVEPERVFIVEPKTLSPEKLDRVRDSRVDFRIR